MGQRYEGNVGSYTSGPVTRKRPVPSSLLDNSGRLFVKSRPQYERLDVSSFLVATQEGIANDGTGDQTARINAFLRKAVSGGKVAYFPGGIYQVQGTVIFPVGSRVQGASWSQIQGYGSYFADQDNPKVVVRAGEKGDVGVLEITDMLFSVRGNTAGAIVVEWNVKSISPGAGI